METKKPETANKVSKPKKEKVMVVQAANVEQIKPLIKKEKSKKDNEIVAVKKITDKKDLIYNYPPDMDDLAKRKKFRTQTRAALKQLDKKIQAIKQAGRKAKPEEKAAVSNEAHLFARTKFQPESTQFKNLLKFA